MSKRKAETVLVRTAKGRTLRERDFLMGNPDTVRKINENRAAAILIRQAKLNAMPLQRNTPQEKGYVDLNGTYAFDSTGTIALAATIAQGPATTQRIGKKIMLRTLQMRGYVYNDSAALYNDCALILVYDTRPTGVLPAITDILGSVSAIALNADNGTSRFQILRRFDWELIGNSAAPSTGQEVKSMDFFTKINRPTVFKSATTGAIGDIQEGALYLVSVGINPAGTTAAIGKFNLRVRFTEN